MASTKKLPLRTTPEADIKFPRIDLADIYSDLAREQRSPQLILMGDDVFEAINFGDHHAEYISGAKVIHVPELSKHMAVFVCLHNHRHTRAFVYGVNDSRRR